jgi:phage tail sheath protein FI
VPQYLHPGVYIEELPAARTIQGASTSVPAFIGYTETGPANVPTLITSWNAYQRQFGSTIWYAFNSWAVYEFFAEGGGACYVIRTLDDSSKPALATVGSIKLAAASPGAWGKSLMVIVSNAVGEPGATAAPAPTPIFAVRVVIDKAAIDKAMIDGTVKPDLPTQLLVAFVQHNDLDVVTLGGKSYYVLENFSGVTEATLSSGNFATRVNSASIFIRVTAPVAGSSAKAARPPNSPTPVPFSGGTAPKYDYDAAVKLIEKVQGVSLLAIPDTPAITDHAGRPDLGAQTAAINLAMMQVERMGSIFYVVDPPHGLDVQEIQALVSGSAPNTTALNSSYSALYYPWIYMFYPLTGANIPIPPSGPVLGRYAETDINVGVFKSPAGVADGAMKTIVAVDEAITDSDQDLLNPHGINAIRILLNYGTVIWGARTLSQDTSWTYINVRRLFIYVEQSLKNSLQWVVFEPNDQRLWAAIDRDISAFLHGLWLQGGLFGATPGEAYFVICDSSNNPPETRSEGVLYVDVGLAAVYPAEFVVIRITQKTAGPDSSS